MNESELKQKWLVELDGLKTEQDKNVFIHSIFKAIKAWNTRPNGVTDEMIEEKMNEAYKKAGNNTYFGNGFTIGAKWALSEQSGWIPVENAMPVDKNKEEPIDLELLAHPDTTIINGYYAENEWWLQMEGTAVGHRSAFDLDITITHFRLASPPIQKSNQKG